MGGGRGAYDLAALSVEGGLDPSTVRCVFIACLHAVRGLDSIRSSPPERSELAPLTVSLVDVLTGLIRAMAGQLTHNQLTDLKTLTHVHPPPTSQEVREPPPISHGRREGGVDESDSRVCVECVDWLRWGDENLLKDGTIEELDFFLESRFNSNSLHPSLSAIETMWKGVEHEGD